MFWTFLLSLQHFGQVVCGQVTATSGRQNLQHITSVVMSVRKPLRSPSALRRRRVTIIFSHDYDRIFFRNDTANLVSHDCHSYLRVTLANGIPPRIAMGMTAENVSYDVDEEVYAGDGDAMSEAREASDGDRRAIADADEAGQMAVSGEAKTPPVLRTPEPPTDAARMLQHTITYHSEIGARSAWQVAREALHIGEWW